MQQSDELQRQANFVPVAGFDEGRPVWVRSVSQKEEPIRYTHVLNPFKLEISLRDFVVEKFDIGR